MLPDPTPKPSQQTSDVRLTPGQVEMLVDIRRTDRPDGGRSWASHSQRRLASLVRRGLVRYTGDGIWVVVESDQDRSECPACHAAPDPCRACAYREAIGNVERAAREVDALLSESGPPFRLDGVRITGEAESALLSLHDYLNDVTIALTGKKP